MDRLWHRIVGSANMRRVNVGRLLVSAVGAAAISLAIEAKAEARGSDFDGLLMLALLVPPATPFLVYDIVVAAQGSEPSTRWAVAEIITTSPPVILTYAINGYSQGRSSEPIPPFFLLFVAPLTGLPIHGSLALAEVNLRPSELVGVSMAIGFDTLFSSTALIRASRRRLSSRWTGVAAMIGAAPQVAAFSYGAAVDEGRRTSWIGLSAWSGAIFLHGLASTLAGATSDEPPPRPTRPSSTEAAGASPPRITMGLAPAYGRARPAPLLAVTGTF